MAPAPAGQKREGLLGMFAVFIAGTNSPQSRFQLLTPAKKSSNGVLSPRLFLEMSPSWRLLIRGFKRHAPRGYFGGSRLEFPLGVHRETYRSFALNSALQAARRAAQEERHKNRLRGLTWEQLLRETPFERWSPSPPFPPEEFTREARNVVHDTCRALRALGSKPRKPDVRRLLREFVEWFNKADEQTGGVIEAEEREDICAVFEEMAYVARQKSLVDEIDDWRTW